jgi:hypothetical protein
MQVMQKHIRALGMEAVGSKVTATGLFILQDFVFKLRSWLTIFSNYPIANMFWSQPYGMIDQGNDYCVILATDW